MTDAEFAVLGLLTRGEASGYDLQATARRNVNLILAPAKSRIYAVLPRLLARGLVTRRRLAQESRPDKQLYNLTEAGWQTFRDWLNDTSPTPSRPGLLLKLFFGRYAEPEALLTQLQDYRERTEEELHFFEAVERKNLEADDGFYYNLTVWCALAMDRAVLRWADRAIQALEER